ncbi:uncharacterized protein LOC119833828 [Zerene cesonia]|uniref:uncharacterized protein LOC119833828 n=1 Tax=Zerene cesonia TaxID=33412 RepID=UPI0018E513C8|nr:uncharacterized protein LOC119833828 [Zerene cesonia]
MEGDNVAVLLASTPAMDVQMVEEGPRVCPLCSSPIKLFFINYNEKLLMCENTECEFPFGYEELQFVQVDSADNETGAIKKRHNFFSQSRSSTSGISATDVDKLYRAYDSEDQSESTSINMFSKPPLRSYNRESRRKMEKNVEDLKNLNLELVKVNSETKITNKTIQDQKLIRNLYNLQDISGVKLLKPQELEILKKEAATKQQDVKIDIDKGSNDISIIKIELVSTDNSNEINNS